MTTDTKNAVRVYSDCTLTFILQQTSVIIEGLLVHCRQNLCVAHYHLRKLYFKADHNIRNKVSVAPGSGTTRPSEAETCEQNANAEPVAYHTADETPLLVILLPEDGDVGLDDVEQLGDHGGHATEEHRPAAPAQPLLQPLDPNPGLVPIPTRRLLQAGDRRAPGSLGGTAAAEV